MVLIIIRIGVVLVSMGLIVVLSQDVQIFPGAMMSFGNTSERSSGMLPEGVISKFITTKDGERIETWRKETTASGKSKVRGAIIFHGNAETVESSYHLQQWLASLGIWSYSFDYRGYNKSSGWPSEEGIYLDADSVWEHVRIKEKVVADEMLFLGSSIGTGPASYLATKVSPQLLILLSPYQSIPKVVQARPYLRMFAPFLWYDFPTEQFVSELKNTNLVVVHGEADPIIPVEQGRKVFAAYKGHGEKEGIFLENVKHNDAFAASSKKLEKFLEKD